MLDGKENRPTLDEVIETAWNHKARKKYENPTLYLENWIRKENKYWHDKVTGYGRKPLNANQKNGALFGPWLDEGYATKEEWEKAKNATS